MKNALLIATLAASPVCAEETVSSTKTSSATSPAVTTTLIVPNAQMSPAVTAADSPSVLDAYGVVSSQHLVTALSASLTPAQRAQLDQAVAARNASLSQANARLNATLRDVLGETNESLKKRIMSPAEAHRMEQMRRAQPARYLHLMSKKKRELEKRQ